MGTIGFSGKAGATSGFEPEQKPKPKIDYDKLVGDQSWYQSYCSKCPYLITADVLNMFVCGCPAGEKCLAKSILVVGAIVADMHNEFQRKQYEDNNGSTAVKPVVNKLTEKRRSKMIKRRR